MLMSEAIRLGAMLGPQCKTLLFHNGATCANGAALTAMGFTESDAYSNRLGYWQDALGGNVELLCDIAELNNAGLTRESIADWLVESGNDFEVQPLPKIEELSPADVAAIQEVTR